ncbi:MAG TPA: fumarylacetoacetate hydrolase family protein, partial [Emcibacteraceae bacterium]|nr:fumarylacetoacetate hydrolase family protein [Emcibacteraceae bacterium]
MGYVFEPPALSSVAIHGSKDRFPVRRIFCVGRNYAAHAREMGRDPDREPPFYFMKPTDALVDNGVDVPYPPQTGNLHYEGELVVAIGKECANVSTENALDYVFGYAVGNDLTRRDLQLDAREKGRPWDTGKGFDHSAPCAEIHTVDQVGHISDARIWLSV